MKQLKNFYVGSGFSYPEDGPTHHQQKIFHLLVITNIELYNPQTLMMKHIVAKVYKSKKPQQLEWIDSFVLRYIQIFRPILTKDFVR